MQVKKESSKSSRPSLQKAEVLQERFVVSYDHVIGEGSFAKVCKGLDRETNKEVAVKLYKCSPDDEEWGQAEKNFQETISTMQELSGVKAPQKKHAGGNRRISFNCDALRSDSVALMGSGDASALIDHMNLGEGFVKLMGYSERGNGDPGFDTEADRLYLVFELGTESLEDCLARHAESGTTLSVDELRCVHWCLVSIVCGLHAAGYVHMDIKPANIVRFGAVWKLIDFDGAVKSGTALTKDKLLATPVYMAPEAAKVLLDDKAVSKVSRLMDVWSVGMCAIEAVFLQPVLMPWYKEWMDETGDHGKYMRWLSDYDAVPSLMDDDMCEAMKAINPDMCSLLQCMLAKDPAHRNDIAECLVHPWFAPMRKQLWKQLDANMNASNGGMMVKSSTMISAMTMSESNSRPRNSLFGRRAIAQHSKACSIQ